MSLDPLQDPNRDVIPRWRESSAAARLGEVAPAKECRVPAEIPLPKLQELVAGYTRSRSASDAADLVSAAWACRWVVDEVRKAAEHVLSKSDLPKGAKAIASAVLQQRDGAEVGCSPLKSLENQGYFYARVQYLKMLLRIAPYNAIAWIDLARVYAVLGHKRSAYRAVTVALGLASDNRFVVRSACRLFVHQGDLGRAHAVVAQSPAVKGDPWVLAAEVATAHSHGKVPDNLALAMKMIRQKSIAPRHLSELMSAVGTFELQRGSRAKGKDLLRASLEEPTENAVAQMHWAARRHRIDAPWTRVPNLEESSPEAAAWQNIVDERWEEAVESAAEWLMDQPFSRRPALNGAHAAWLGKRDASTAIQFTDIGLRANADDFTLVNNLVFYYLQYGDIAGAKKAAHRIGQCKVTEEDSVVWLATKGLIAIRDGEMSVGRARYLRAIGRAQERGQLLRAAIAAIYLAIEECRCRTSEAAIAVNRARDLARKARGIELKPLMQQLSTAESQVGHEVVISTSSVSYTPPDRGYNEKLWMRK